ncbi:MAG TPA: hypothetical protein VF624_07420 [Tepidisphaeraceae bacterium]
MRYPIFELARPGLLALRQYWKPFVLIEVCGAVVVVLYFNNDAVRGAADALATMKASGGLLFAAIAGAVAGAILPEIGKAIALGDTRVTRRRLDDVCVNLALFAALGLIADLFYALLNRLFGDGPHLGPVVAKVLADQLLYAPFVTLPLVALVFTCRGCGWSPRRTAQQLGRTWYLRRVVTLLIPCWCFWVPMTALMFSLPASLTFLFAMFALAAWGLLMIYIAQYTQDADQPGERTQNASPVA